MTDFCIANPEAPVGGATLDPTRILTRASNPGACKHGPNLPTHTFGMHTTLSLPYGLTFNARGEYMGGHYMYDGAAFNAVVRSVRWPGCYDFYKLQEAGRVAEARAIDFARCTVSLTRDSYFIYPADFFKLRDVSLGFQVPQRYLRGRRSLRADRALRTQRLEAAEQGLPRLRSGDQQQRRVRFTSPFHPRACAAARDLHGVHAPHVLTETRR